METALPAAEVAFRLIPLVLLLGTAVTAAVAALNNLTAPGANLDFVRHIMTMDTTNRDRGVRWREVRSPALHRAAFAAILVCELAVAALGLAGSFFLAVNLTAGAEAWESAKLFGYLAFLAALAVWFLIIQVVGAEWYVSWQSEKWNAIRDSIRINLITVAGIIILRLS